MSSELGVTGWLIRLALLVVSCVGAAALIASAPVEEDLPTPYAADEIRDAYRPGLEIWSERSGGGEVERTRTVVLEADAERVRLGFERYDAGGRQVGERRELGAAWGELRDHAKFAAASARRERARRATPLGALDGWVYRVVDGEESRELFFADAYPGPPVTFVRMRAGRVVERVDIVRIERPEGSLGDEGAR